MSLQANVDTAVLCPDSPLRLSHLFSHLLGAWVVDNSWLNIFL